jgi:protein gp37
LAVTGTPAAVRFISAEPLLGPLDLHSIEALCRTWRRGLTVGTYLDWVIAGGESGAACRPSNPEWFRSLRDQCIETETAFHFKQWGGIHAKANGCELDGREWKQFPAQAPERSTGSSRAVDPIDGASAGSRYARIVF